MLVKLENAGNGIDEMPCFGIGVGVSQRPGPQTHPVSGRANIDVSTPVCLLRSRSAIAPHEMTRLVGHNRDKLDHHAACALLLSLYNYEFTPTNFKLSHAIRRHAAQLTTP